MFVDQEDVYFYLTLMNENYVHPDMPAGAEEGIVRGLYRLRETEAQLRLLQEIKLDPAGFRMFRFDGEIMTPAEPFKPKKALIVALATVLGLMTGVMLAFVAEFVAKARSSGSTPAR